MEWVAVNPGKVWILRGGWEARPSHGNGTEPVCPSVRGGDGKVDQVTEVVQLGDGEGSRRLSS